MPHPATEQQLLTDAHALRRLARSLLGADGGDDVFQDVALAALTGEPDQRRDLRRWLRGAVHKMARLAQRSERRRRARQARAALAEVDRRDPATLAMQAELVRDVGAAVHALDEPLRSAILLHFWHGLSAAAIAARLGLPASTVRSRLQRGVALLRSSLDRRHGSERWGAALAAFAGGVRRSRVVGFVGGWMVGYVMKSKLIVAVAAMLLVVVAVWPQLGEAAPPSPAPAAGEAPLPVGAVGPAARAGRARLAVSTSQSAVGGGAAVAGNVRDATGMPLAGVHVTAQPVEQSRVAGERSAGSTDSLGCFSFSLPAGAEVELAFTCSGYRPARAVVCAPSKGVDVVLERSPALRGRVVRGDGRPVGGALVRWSNPHLALGNGDTHTTEPDGRFEFVDVPRGIDLEVTAPDALPFARLVTVDWNMPELVITLDHGREATGSVVDGDSGAGIAGAVVELWYYQGSYTAEGRRGGRSQLAETVTTGANGAFTLTRLPSVADEKRADACLWVMAPGRAPHWQVVAAAERADGLLVNLYRAGSVRGRVIDASGAPVAGQRVYAEAKVQRLCDADANLGFRQQHNAYSRQWSTRRPEPAAPFQTERELFTDPDGAYRIDSIPCPAGGGEVTVAILAGHPAVTVLARPGEVATAADIIRPDGVFRRWHGIVRDESGRAIAGALVELGACTRSDADGHFELEAPADVQGELTLCASAPGCVPCRRLLVPSRGLFAECDAGGVTITLARANRLAVSVVDRAERPVPDAAVHFFVEGALAEFARGGRRPWGLGIGRSDDRGAVLLEGVPATADILVEYPFVNTGRHQRVLHGVATGAGNLTVSLDDLDLFEGTATLTLRILDGRSAATFDGQVLVDATSAKGMRRGLARGPEIRLDVLPLGEWEIRLVGEGLGSHSERIDLIGNQRLDVRLGAGLSISGRVTCAVATLARPVQVQARAIASAEISLARTDA